MSHIPTSTNATTETSRTLVSLTISEPATDRDCSRTQTVLLQLTILRAFNCPLPKQLRRFHIPLNQQKLRLPPSPLPLAPPPKQNGWMDYHSSSSSFNSIHFQKKQIIILYFFPDWAFVCLLKLMRPLNMKNY